MSIRPARPDDAPRLAEVHIRAWRETYRGIMPDQTLADLSLVKSTESWTKRLTALPDRQAVFVACNEQDEPVGFVATGPKRLPELPTDGEIFAINLVNEAKRKRLGLHLMHAASQRLIADGFQAIGLWVLERNVGARAFYERLGGIVATQREQAFGEATLTELGTVWAHGAALELRARQLIDG